MVLVLNAYWHLRLEHGLVWIKGLHGEDVFKVYWVLNLYLLKVRTQIRAQLYHSYYSVLNAYWPRHKKR
jgi:hypothetical protein